MLMLKTIIQIFNNLEKPKKAMSNSGSKLFVASYEIGDDSEPKTADFSKAVISARKVLMKNYTSYLAYQDRGTDESHFLIGAGVVSIDNGGETITLVHSSEKGLEKLASELNLPFPSLTNLPLLNYNPGVYNDLTDVLDVHIRS